MSEVELLTLEEPLLRMRAEELVALDAEAYEQAGDAYAETPWMASHFRQPLPEKFECSVLATRGDRVVGFWIASRRTDDVLYTHRVAVAGDQRGGGIGRLMFARVREAAGRIGARLLALSVNDANEPAARFYEGLGFRRVGGSRLVTLAAEWRLAGEVDGDVYRTPSGIRNRLYSRPA